jgi:LPS-assembly protein
MITSKQGPLVQAEWRQRLINGSYMVRASGIFQLDKQAFSTMAILPETATSVATSSRRASSG